MESIGQHNLPGWTRCETALSDIFARRYYTNHGPLAQQLEQQLASLLGVRHAIVVTNANIGLIISAKALNWTGRVLVSALAPRAVVDAVRWANLAPSLVDVDARTHTMDLGKLKQRLAEPGDTEAATKGILASQPWGIMCSPCELQAIASEHGVGLLFDAARSAACSLDGRPLSSWGDLSVVSLAETEILNASEGGCVCTNDDLLAARVRNMRSSYGAGESTPIPITGNARMSEAQAALALLSLEDLHANIAHNRRCFEIYAERLESVEHARLLRPASVTQSSCAYVIVEIQPDLVESVTAALTAAKLPFRLAYSTSHRTLRTPVADSLARTTLQLPLGQSTSEAMVEAVCERVVATFARTWEWRDNR